VEEGTTTTPFDMTACNGMSRYQLAIEALRLVGLEDGTAELARMLEEDRRHTDVHGVDAPRVTEWRWGNPAPGAAA
jgi:xylulose-5-phosphate/fructose-6-phosphate phosphoketolase